MVDNQQYGKPYSALPNISYSCVQTTPPTIKTTKSNYPRHLIPPS